MGGAKVAELDALIAGAEQFLWGPAELAAGVPEVLERLRAAKTWVSKVRAVLQSRSTCTPWGACFERVICTTCTSADMLHRHTPINACTRPHLISVAFLVELACGMARCQARAQ